MYLHHIFLHRMNIISKRFLSWHFKKNWIIYTTSYSNLVDISRENFLSLDSMVDLRRNEARRSILIEVKEQEVEVLQLVCSHYGNIKNAFASQPTERKNLCIIEFEEEASLKKILGAAQTMGTELEERVLLPFFRFSADGLNFRHLDSENDARVDFQSETPEMSEAEMIDHMTYNCSSISEQIQYFHDFQKMTEIGWRLRFLTCRKMEWLLPAVLSHCTMRPFGSCVNTFGNRHCDVDMSIELSPRHNKQSMESFSLCVQHNSISSANSHGKGSLRVFGDLLTLYMPGVEKVQAILNATVPIIKCRDSLIGLDCDISIQDNAFHMSEILYLFGCADWRVRPLVFCVRWWAKTNGLTRKMEPWHWFSNFQLTFFVLFFLMNTKPVPVLPALRTLQMTSHKTNALHSHGISYFNVQDISRVPISTNTQTLEELLIDFFEFYLTFNFSKHAISLVSGRTYTKPNYTSLYVQNPLERELNVCKNISHEQVEAFQLRCAEAVRVLDSSSKMEESDSAHSLWGLLTLCISQPAPLQRKRSSDSLTKFDAASLLRDVSGGFDEAAKATLDCPQLHLNHHQKKKKRRNFRRAPEFFF